MGAVAGEYVRAGCLFRLLTRQRISFDGSRMIRGLEQAGTDEMKMMAQLLHKMSQRDVAGEQYRFIITNTNGKTSARESTTTNNLDLARRTASTRGLLKTRRPCESLAIRIGKPEGEERTVMLLIMAEVARSCSRRSVGNHSSRCGTSLTVFVRSSYSTATLRNSVRRSRLDRV